MKCDDVETFRIKTKLTKGRNQRSSSGSSTTEKESERGRERKWSNDKKNNDEISDLNVESKEG